MSGVFFYLSLHFWQGVTNTGEQTRTLDTQAFQGTGGLSELQDGTEPYRSFLHTIFFVSIQKEQQASKQTTTTTIPLSTVHIQYYPFFIAKRDVDVDASIHPSIPQQQTNQITQ